MQLSSTAIVLKKIDIGETDRVYSFLTLEYGKVRAVARGVRKSEAKLAGQLETLNLVHLSVMKSRGKGNIASAIAEAYFSHIRESEASLRAAMEGVSLVDRLTEEDESDRDLFALLLEYLRALDIVSALPRLDAREELRFLEKIFLLSQGFSWKLLARLGYSVEARVCAAGREALPKNERYFFSPDLGGIVCARHREKATTTFSLGENAIKFLRLIFANSLASLPKLSIDRDATLSLRRALKSFLDWIG
jgi:DNA repair protein RecO (recombination protein O)